MVVEVLGAVTEAVPSSKVGIRVSHARLQEDLALFVIHCFGNELPGFHLLFGVDIAGGSSF